MNEEIINKLSLILSEKVAENISQNFEIKDGKALIELKPNEDYIRGVRDTVDAFVSILNEVGD